jgi:hypothetical protein
MRRLTLTKAKIDRAVILARKYYEAFPPDVSGEPRNLFEVDSGAEVGAENQVIAELFNEFLVALSPQEMRELQSMMYLGRGDFPAAAFWTECDELDMDDDPEREADHVTAKAAVLVDYLYEGFSRINLGRII